MKRPFTTHRGRVGPAHPARGDELDEHKLSPQLRYDGAIADAVQDLGQSQEIRGLFVGFQRHLYERRTLS